MTSVYIAESVWKQVTAEVDHYAGGSVAREKGARLPFVLRFHYRSRESAFYTLFGFQRNEECRKPAWAILDIDDIEYFVVPYVFVPPRKYCRHGAAHARFEFRNEQELLEFHQLFAAWKEPIHQQFPTLLDIGNIHAHQFAHNTTYPSGTDYGRVYDVWHHLYTENGLNTVLEIIVCQSADSGERWKACCFAFDQYQRIVDLGPAEIVPDDHPAIAKVLQSPYDLSSDGRRWQRRQTARLERVFPGAIVQLKRFWGWTTWRVTYNERIVDVYLPPSYPKCDSILYKHDAAHEASVVQVWPKQNPGFSVDLCLIAQQCFDSPAPVVPEAVVSGPVAH